MSQGLSVRTRAALAVGLLVGFYALALAMAGGLLFLPYALYELDGHRIVGRLVLFCVVGAFLILKSIVPRPDRFEPPGPRLDAAGQPALFALIDDVARATGQAPPAEVYLVSDVNAWVAERGGLMGVGSRRVMGVGLPLLEALSVAELRAVIAHEFGHYVGGDTRLGPWVYRTRAAIERTLENLGQHSSALSKPFQWYGLGFLRVTHAVSRQQEYVADAVAARVAGVAPAAGALRRIAGAAAAYGSYWRSELGPALERGYRPPVASGFGQFLRAGGVAPAIAALVDEEAAAGKSDPYDTHPCLRERLAAIEGIADAARAEPASTAAGAADAERRPAIALLSDLDVLEAQLIASLATKDAPPLVPVSWDDAPRVVLPDGWRDVATRHAAGLAGLTPEALPALVRVPGALEARLRLAPDAAHVTEEDVARASVVIGSALALALLARAADASAASRPRLHAPPGEPVAFHVGDVVMLPFAARTALADGSLGDDAWAAQCTAAGIAGVDLGGVAAHAPARAPALKDLAPLGRGAATRA